MRRLPLIRSAVELTALVNELGFLPFFRCRVPGFSVEECTPAEYWFVRDVEGPWEWKGPVICGAPCLYGKLFEGKAGYVSRDWIPDLLNYRRDGLDFDERYDMGGSSYHARQVYELVSGTPGGILSRELKRRCGFEGKAKQGFDGLLAALQMQTWLCVRDFEYAIDRHGWPYGWGLARYDTPEAVFGAEYAKSAMEQRSPEESGARILAHLKTLWPEADEPQLKKLIRL